MATRRFYLREARRVSGPYSADAIAARFRAHAIGPETQLAEEVDGDGARGPGPFVPAAEFLKPSDQCERCGSKEASPRPLTTVTSLIVVTRWRSTAANLCDRCGARSATGALVTTGLLGWWGFPSGLIRTPGALGRNAATLLKTRMPKLATLALTAALFLVPVGAGVGIYAFVKRVDRTDQEAGREQISVAAGQHIQASRAATKRGDRDGALREALAASAAEPDSWLAQAEVGNAYEALGQFSKAAAASSIAVRRNPHNRELRQQLLEELCWTDDLDVAETEAADALQRWPDLSEAQAARAHARALRGRLDEVRESLRSPWAVSSAGLLVTLEVAFGLIEAARAEEALAFLGEMEARWSGPDAQPARTMLVPARASVLTALGRFPEALALLEAPDIAPGARPRQAIVELEAGDYAKAEEILRELVAAKQQTTREAADNRLWHGVALARLGRAEDARAAWAAVPKGKSGERPTFEQDACAFLTTGKGVETLKAHAKHPLEARTANDAALLEGLRDELAGDLVPARAAYQRCVDASPGSGFPAHLARRSLAALAGR